MNGLNLIMRDMVTEQDLTLILMMALLLWAYGVVVSMFDFHRRDRGSNPGCGGKI